MASQRVRVALVVTLLGKVAACGRERQVAPDQATLQDAMGLFRQGETRTSLVILQRLASAQPRGRQGDEARLGMATVLLAQKRDAEALAPLETVVANGEVAPAYAALLYGRAASNSNQKLAEAERMLAPYLVEGDEGPLITAHAQFLTLKLRHLQGHFPGAASVGRTFLENRLAGTRFSEGQWLTADALLETGRLKEAYRGFESIWLDTPSSPWAVQARDRMRALQDRTGLPARTLSPPDQLAFARSLQKAGLHKEAVEELEAFSSAMGQHTALLLKATSLYPLGRRSECVRTAVELRRRFGHTPDAAAGALIAVRVFLAAGDESGIREWVQWLQNGFPGHPKTWAAVYNLAVHLLLTAGREREGMAVLAQMIDGGRGVEGRDDALWKLAWAHRRLGATDQAVAVLRQLLSEYPDGGYKKGALYWIGRFTSASDPQGAVECYRTLVEEFTHDYYGHEAAKSLIGLRASPRRVGGETPFPAVDHLDDASRRPGSEPYARAVNLRRVGLFEFAAEELDLVPDSAKDPQLQFARADLYARAGDTWRAAAIVEHSFKQFTIAGSRDPRLVPGEFWHIWYPYNYRAVIERATTEAGLRSAQMEPALVAALIRVESRFLPTAISPVGAVGLMQIMPDTAQQIAKTLTGGTVTRRELFDPETNIRFGTFFLAGRVKDFGGEWFPAICSYNSGVGPVRKWWANRTPGLAQDEFIETIPYLDTRLYIKQVLGDYRNYEWIYSSQH